MATCKKCGSEYTKKSNHAKFCEDCRSIGYIKKPILINLCEICKDFFPTSKPNKNTCSEKCKNTQKRRKAAESYLKSKQAPGKFKCPCCGKNKSREKYCYCRDCTKNHQLVGTDDTMAMEHGIIF